MRRVDRRAVFFLVAALACFLLVPVADSEFRGLAGGLGAAYLVLALASYLDYRSER